MRVEGKGLGLFGHVPFGEGTDLSVHRVLDRGRRRAEQVAVGGGFGYRLEVIAVRRFGSAADKELGVFLRESESLSAANQ